MLKKITTYSLSIFILILLSSELKAQHLTRNYFFQGNQFIYDTILTDGYYYLTAKGAKGGGINTDYGAGANGAIMSGYFYFRRNDILRIAVGGKGQAGGFSNNNLSGSGGGGASSFVLVSANGTLTPLLFAAGGGGAAPSDGFDIFLMNANSIGKPGLTGPDLSGNGGAINSDINGGAGGAGFFIDGGTHFDKNNNLLSYGGQAYLSGNYGGSASTIGGYGGWGGGGQGGVADGSGLVQHDGGGGGGGGYVGGDGGGTNKGGNGGISFLASFVNRNGLAPNLKGDDYNSGDYPDNGTALLEGPFYDTDNDGFIDRSDNCPYVYNPDQKDANLNGIGDICEPEKHIFSFIDSTFQFFIVPQSAWYRIEAYGANGGIWAYDVQNYINNITYSWLHYFGKGALMKGYFHLTAGDTLRIAVGGLGKNAIYPHDGPGGGGGTFVEHKLDHPLLSGNSYAYSPLLVAGGGGGGAAYNRVNNDGLITENGNGGDGHYAGVGGLGTFGGGLSDGASTGGAGGGGYLYFGESFVSNNNGGTYLAHGGASIFWGNWGGSSPNKTGGDGGWGGGGEGGTADYTFINNFGGGGGGGGYSGGGGGRGGNDNAIDNNNRVCGFGGGSYIDTTANTNGLVSISGANTMYGNGLVIIEKVTDIDNDGWMDEVDNCLSTYNPDQLDLNHNGIGDTCEVINHVVSFTNQGNSFQYYTAPSTGYYKLETSGAQGGDNINLSNGSTVNGGKGAYLNGIVLLNEGDQLQIGIGEKGKNGVSFGNYMSGAGGGGATSIIKLSGSSTLSNGPILISGGGGGAGSLNAGDPGQITTYGSFQYFFGAPYSIASNGGLNGNGGTTYGDVNAGTGGGGYIGNGDSYSQSQAMGGQSYLNGNAGGSYSLNNNGGDGGWGGGGEGGNAGSSSSGGGGGGGGYSGGGGGSDGNGGGGGGSLNATSFVKKISSDINAGNGLAKINGPNIKKEVINSMGPYTWQANGVTYSQSGTYTCLDTSALPMFYTRILDLSVNALPAACLSYVREDTSVISCGPYTWYRNGRTYTENSIDSFRSGCTRYILHVSIIPTSFPSPAKISGITSVCPYIGTGSELSYTAPLIAGATYTWTLPLNVSLVSGQGTNSIIVKFNNGFAAQANKQLKVKATTVCGSVSLTAYLNALAPATPAVITASTSNICASIGSTTGVKYTIPKVAASSYIWTAQNGTTTISHPNGTGENDTAVLVNFSSNFTTSNITVQAVNPCGLSLVKSLTINRSNPSQPGIISGPTNTCSYTGDTGSRATYSVTANALIQQYTWSIPQGATLITGQGTRSISFRYPAGFTGGTLSVTATNGCGTSTSRSLIVNRLSAATPGTITATSIAACPDRIYNYSIASMPANATSLEWVVPVNGTIVSGQGTTSVTVSYTGSAVSGQVKVRALNNCSVSSYKTLTVNLPVCAAPGIAYGKKIPESLANEMLVKAFPNPSRSSFNLQVSGTDKKLRMMIWDAQGRLVKSMMVMPNQTTVFGNELKPGVYLIEIRNGKEVKTTRVVKY